jgi:hypothetical protein
MTTAKSIKEHIMILLLFILLTALMTYPFIFNLEKAENLGDPLFISWTLAWDVHKLFTDPINFLILIQISFIQIKIH